MEDRAPEEPTTAEREGVVDQQGAARERAGADDSGDRESSDSAAERAGVVDQQGSIAEDLEGG
jgi:hypothetical protein